MMSGAHDALSPLTLVQLAPPAWSSRGRAATGHNLACPRVSASAHLTRSRRRCLARPMRSPSRVVLCRPALCARLAALRHVEAAFVARHRHAMVTSRGQRSVIERSGILALHWPRASLRGRAA
ncbi:hypothetical protein PR202_gb26475 [Eleusine coracana subsp. coracana]|uniref:Uncharacterized protein n=1 Tax=Eleusine coracana subsp. coracana TaxID=191504 RepID=A0AAV5FRY5_ELECO|nr:hypothetical protein PR202_gb26475 [Eleusine coracana subsp. coracana]